MDATAVSDWFRAQPSLTGSPPALDLGALPADPVELFLTWVRDAANAGVAEPHAATLATVDEEGLPDARTLILKDAGARGWAFASQRSSRKGGQLAARPAAALNFWWQPVVRAVRVRGTVQEATRAESAADFAARSPASRAGIAPTDWVRWQIVPRRIEFWQGSPDRRHTRIVYSLDAGNWTHSVFTD